MLEKHQFVGGYVAESLHSMQMQPKTYVCHAPLAVPHLTSSKYVPSGLVKFAAASIVPSKPTHGCVPSGAPVAVICASPPEWYHCASIRSRKAPDAGCSVSTDAKGAVAMCAAVGSLGKGSRTVAWSYIWSSVPASTGSVVNSLAQK